jgi:tellurite resistance protein TerC
MNIEYILWGVFILLFVLVFTIDMYVTDHRKGKIKVKNALIWTAVWISTALLFSSVIYFYLPGGKTKAFEFITGYLIEYSLSVDNLFVFILIFTMMGITEKNQPRILKWGIIGAVVLRVLFIIAGVELIKAFSFMIYLLGAVLVFTAIKMFTSKEEKYIPTITYLLKLQKMFKIKTNVGSDHFFVRENGQLYATVAFITVVLLESTDVVFAIDSIPAVLAITQDSFIAITSNLFAILGLRSLFFALAGILNLFRYLKFGISFILLFIGVKMLISGWVHIPVQTSLVVILATLVVSILASVVIKETEEVDHHAFHEHPPKVIKDEILK